MATKVRPGAALPARRTLDRLLMLVGLMAALAGSLALALQTDIGSARPSGLPPARPPRRIVSLAPSLTETVFALGAGDRLVGATRFCDYPPEALRVPRVGGMLDVSVEKVVDLAPDLVLASSDSNRAVTLTQLRDLGISVAELDASDFEGVLRQTVTVGRLIGEEVTAARLTAKLRERAARVARAVAGARRPRVLYLVWADPAIVPGRGTVIDDLLHRAGAECISAAEAIPWPRYSLEQIVAVRPEVIIMGRHGSGQTERAVERWRREGLSLPAFENGRVYVIDGDLVHRPGPRVIDGLEALARLIHPGRLS